MVKVKSKQVTIRFSEEVLKRLETFIQDDNVKPESGGILVGYFIEPDTFSVTDISTPSKKDKASRFGFIRSKKSAQKFIDKHFENSRGKKIYLGEWHTHPEDYPTPSFVDKCSIKLQYTKNRLNSTVIFMVIIGRKSIYIASYSKGRMSVLGNIYW